MEPLASRPSAFAERPSVLEGTLSAFVERLSVLEETLSAFVEQRCERFDVVKPLASRPSARAERLSVLEETLSAFVERLSAHEETLSAFVEQEVRRRGTDTWEPAPATAWASIGLHLLDCAAPDFSPGRPRLRGRLFSPDSGRWKLSRFYWDGGTPRRTGAVQGVLPSPRPIAPGKAWERRKPCSEQKPLEVTRG